MENKISMFFGGMLIIASSCLYAMENTSDLDSNRERHIHLATSNQQNSEESTDDD